MWKWTAGELIVTDRTLNQTSWQHAEHTLTHLLKRYEKSSQKYKDQTTQGVSPDPAKTPMLVHMTWSHVRRFYAGLLSIAGRSARGRGRALLRPRCREQLLLGGLGVDDAEHVVHSGGDVVRRRQAAPFLHLQQHSNSKHAVVKAPAGCSCTD